MQVRLIILCIVELLLITFCINLFGPFISPIVLLATSMGIAVYYLRITNSTQPSQPKEYVHKTQAANIAAVSFGVLSIGVCALMAYIIRRFPISATHPASSDIIPTLVFFAKRTLAGAFPYTMIHFPSHDLFPTYLPFTWMPFCIAEFFKMDYRWIATTAFWLVALYYFFKALSSKFHYTNLWQKLLVALWPLIIWLCITLDEITIPAYTIESLIAAYYLLLALSTQYKNIVFLSICIAVCLLSRYSILFWTPLCFLIIWISGKPKNALLMCGIIVLIILVTYVLPFLSHDAQIFIKGYNYYTDAAIGEWKNGDQNKFWHLGNGLGFTKWMFALGNSLPLEKKLFLYQKIHIAACILSVLVLMMIYLSKKHPAKSFLLFSLKVYLAVFYAFIQVPYKYLFIVPVVVSSVLLLYTFSQQRLEANNVD